MREHASRRQYLNVSQMFENVRHINYCVISNYERLPLDTGNQIDVLTDNVKGLLIGLDLVRIEGNTYRTQENLSTGKPLKVRVFEKGKRTFPEGFESQILGRKTVHNNCVYVPDLQTYFLIRMYWRTFFEELFLNEPDRAVMVEYLKRNVGEPITPKEKGLVLNKKKVG